MSLNIKNEQVHALALELAQLTGESLTQSIRVAIELRLKIEREKRVRKGGKAERILALAKRFADGLERPVRSEDHASMLYDELGLPK